MPGEYETITDGLGNMVNEVKAMPDYQTWGPDPIVNASPSWKKKKSQFQFWLRENIEDIGDSFNIDEIALMFSSYNEEGMHAFIKDAVREPGVKMFNSARDHVKTRPIFSQYDVEYNFLEVEDLGMRVEVMRIDRGVSPLHQTISEENLNHTLVNRYGRELIGPTVVHFSFKVPTSEEYYGICEAMGRTEAEPVQLCRSTYGQFSYWRIPSIGENIYLKPRCNERDPEPIVVPDPPPNTEGRGEFGMPTVGRRIQDVPQA